MGKYGQAAVLAVKLFVEGDACHPLSAWNDEVAAVFPESRSSQEKGCPRVAFLGLCEEGLVLGVPAGAYTRSALNKGYAVEAVRLLRENPSLGFNEETLWQCVLRGEEKTPNNQMDVVLSLWNNGFIEAGVDEPPARSGS